MSHANDVSPAELRTEVSPVSERFVSFALGDGIVVFDTDDTDRWLCSDVAWTRDEMR